MHQRKAFAALLVLALTGSALGLQQQKLYRNVFINSESDEAFAEGVVAVQQHTVFLEIIVETRNNVTTVAHFAAVVGLVKKCREVRNVFDNAVLWFNDQFLFGNKSNKTVNVTPPNAMGANPNRTINSTNLLDPNRNNGTDVYNPATGGFEVDQIGTGPNEGGNPDRDGFIRAQDFKERWGGCFIPNGFVHAIGSDDPYSLGQLARADAKVEPDVGPPEVSASQTVGVDNIAVVRQLIELDNLCEGCVFEHVTSFFITDPNNHRWIVDKLVYPSVLETISDDLFSLTNCHFGPSEGQTLLPIAGDCDTRTDQPGAYEDQPTQLQQLGIMNPTTDVRGDERLKITTREPLYTVHVQVDPWNPDRQGFPDEAIWAYREDGRLRLGMPYTEDPNHFCHDAAEVGSGVRHAPMGAGGGTNEKADAYEYDLVASEGGPASEPPPPPAPAPNPDPSITSEDWAEYRRGPVGNTVECAIEYNFLLAVDFEAFDNVNHVSSTVALPRDTPDNLVSGAPNAPAGAWANASSQDEGTGENEIVRRGKEHGTGGIDDADKAWQGNSHPHNPQDCHPPPSGPGPCDSGPQHLHDLVVLDLFFSPRAPYFVEQNPYWDHYNSTDALVTAGIPPIWNVDCSDTQDPNADPQRRDAILERRNGKPAGRCDVSAVDGFHLHDGTQTIGTPPQSGGPTKAETTVDKDGAHVETGPNGPNPDVPP